MQLRYVYIVDDDVAFPVGAIDFYLQQIRKQPGLRNGSWSMVFEQK